MNRKIATLIFASLFAGVSPWASAAEVAPSATVSSVDAAMQKKITQKVNRLIETAKITDAARIEKVKAIGTAWFTTLFSWHKEHDAEISQLWSQWNKARSVVPKDEFPGELVAVKIEEVYATLQPAYADYIAKLSVELTPEQIDAVKEAWSRSPGMVRTYNSYLAIASDLSEKDKEVIKARMHLAREAAMLTDSDKEIVSIFKRHKVKVEQYIGSLEWAKLHKAYAAGATKPKPTASVSAK